MAAAAGFRGGACLGLRTRLLRPVRPAGQHLPVGAFSAHCPARWFSSKTISRHPSAEDTFFARRVASCEAAALSASDVSRAAHVAAQVLRLPPSEAGQGSDPWAVPLGQLLRAIVMYPGWLVPTAAHPNGGGQEALQTLLTNDDKPLLVACADKTALAAAPSPEGSSDGGSLQGSFREMEGAGLVWQWRQSQVAAMKAADDAAIGDEEEDGGLRGVVLNPTATDSSCTFGQVVLPYMLGLAAARPVEQALAVLAPWYHRTVLDPAQEAKGDDQGAVRGGAGAEGEDEDEDEDDAVFGALHALARFPFTALIHVDSETGDQRLHANTAGQSILLTGVDLAARASELVLGAHRDGAAAGENWQAVQLPLSAVLQASVKAAAEVEADALDDDDDYYEEDAGGGGGAGVEFIYGWAAPDTACASTEGGGGSPAEGGAEVLSLAIPQAQSLLDLFEAAGVDIRPPSPSSAPPATTAAGG